MGIKRNITSRDQILYKTRQSDVCYASEIVRVLDNSSFFLNEYHEIFIMLIHVS
jgi:hypothetical protein